MVFMPLVLRVSAAMAGCEYGGGGAWVERSGGLGWDGWGVLVEVLEGVTGVVGGCGCGMGSLLV